MKGRYYQDGHYYPQYPVALGAEVQKFRRAARLGELTKDEKRRYGAAVGEAIRRLQRTELQSCLTPTPSLNYRYQWRPTFDPFARYRTPNPFRMVGDPAHRSEESLYQHALKQKAKRE